MSKEKAKKDVRARLKAIADRRKAFKEARAEKRKAKKTGEEKNGRRDA